jgi:hypothetical protein
MNMENLFFLPLLYIFLLIKENILTAFELLGYDMSLNGYSLIPSWWRDRPYEAQQPNHDT